MSNEADLLTHLDRERFDTLVRDRWVSRERHPDADLFIYNYTNRTLYKNHWTPETRAARGLILDSTGAVIARPFPKFFDYRAPQTPTPLPDEPFTVAEKVDGSLGVLYYLDGIPRIATRGSFVGYQAKLACEMILEREIEDVPGITPLFEIIHPANRVVVDYGDTRDLVLLAAIDNATGRDAPLPRWSGNVVKSYPSVPISRLVEMARPNHEGFVLTFASGLRVKLKFAEYVRLHKVAFGVSNRTVWESMAAGDDLESLLEGLPDELYDWIFRTRADLRHQYDDIASKAREVFAQRPATDDRRQMAAYFKASGAHTGALFNMLDGQPIDEIVWKAIRPKVTGFAHDGFAAGA